MPHPVFASIFPHCDAFLKFGRPTLVPTYYKMHCNVENALVNCKCKHALTEESHDVINANLQKTHIMFQQFIESHISTIFFGYFFSELGFTLMSLIGLLFVSKPPREIDGDGVRLCVCVCVCVCVWCVTILEEKLFEAKIWFLNEANIIQCMSSLLLAISNWGDVRLLSIQVDLEKLNFFILSCGSEIKETSIPSSD